jgi:hypothetical protein
VQNSVLVGDDYFCEDASAWNIFRVNLVSNNSGGGQRTYNADGTIVSTTLVDSALGSERTPRVALAFR